MSSFEVSVAPRNTNPFVINYENNSADDNKFDEISYDVNSSENFQKEEENIQIFTNDSDQTKLVHWLIGSDQEIVDEEEIFESANSSTENDPCIKSDDDTNDLKRIVSNLAFDCNSSNSLSSFLHVNSFKLSSSINSIPTQQNQDKDSLKKSLSSANISSFESSNSDIKSAETSLIVGDNNNNNMMNVASKKRGLFSRGSKTIGGGSSLGANATSSTSINDNFQEENKINKASSSPSSSSHQFNEIDEDRFNGDGVQFQGKLIGHEYVAEARGEQMCQQSLKKLKIIQKALGGHKRKINLFISFDGIKILDAQTGEELFHHSVPQISFISRDETDTRAFGYVFGNSQTGHQFIGIKTKKEAMIVMSTIGQLFAITLKRKRSAEQEQQAAAVLSSGDEHLYHSVPEPTSLISSSQIIDIGNSNNDLISSADSAMIKSRVRLRPSTGSSLENVPIPALPPPSDQHARHRQHNNQQNNRFATIGRGNDINNNISQQKNLSSSLINDLFRSSNVIVQNHGSALDPQVSNQEKPVAASFDWANFDDDHNQSSVRDDSTMNTISSISDTLTFSQDQQTLNDSVTLVADQQQHLSNQKFQINSKPNINHQNKLNSSSTTISSANFDGMDPFSDAFGSDPFSTASTTADISSNVFSTKAPNHPQQQIRPPSNPGPQTIFDSNTLSFKEMNSGSVPALTDSFGSLSLNKSAQYVSNDQKSNNSFKSNIELSNQNQSLQADKYAVLADINSISTSIFDSIGPETKMEKDDKRSKTPTPPPQVAAVASVQQRAPIPEQFNNMRKSNLSPVSYGINGVVVLPPVSTASNFYHNEYSTVNMDEKNKRFSKSSNSNEMSNINQNINSLQQQNKPAPKAEFDSMSNLSSNSSINSTANLNLQQKRMQTKSVSDSSQIPLFQELDPLNNNDKMRNSLLNFGNFNENRNRSPMPNPNGLDSSISSMNSSNSSLFNNSLTSNTLQKQYQNSKSPQLLSSHQYSLPVMASSSSSSNNNNNLMKLQQFPTANEKIDEVSDISIDDSNKNDETSNITKTETPKSLTSTKSITTSPHYIVLYNINTSPLQSHEVDDNHIKESDKKLSFEDENIVTKEEEDADKSKLVDDNDNQGFEAKEIHNTLSSSASSSSSSMTNLKDEKIENSNNDKSKDEDNNLSDGDITGNDNKNNNRQHSPASSISSSSDSLLLQQENSNFSELKFDDVFDQPLLKNDANQSKIDEESSDKKIMVEEKSSVTKSSNKTRTESVTSIKSNSSAVNKVQVSTTSLSRQSSTSSTPPIPPRTDLQNKYQNQISGNMSYPLPPPHSHHSFYGSRIYPQQQQQQHYPHQPYPYPYYPSPPPLSGPLPDPYVHRPNSSSSQHHQHRFHPSYYDSWYCNQNDPIYSTPQRPPLDYPPQIPPPPVPSNISPNYLGYHGNPNDYYANSLYYQQQQQQQQPHINSSSLMHHSSQAPQPMSSSTLSLSSAPIATHFPFQHQDKQPMKSSSRSSSPPLSNIDNNEETAPLARPPTVPNPQRRIPATSVSSSSGGAISSQSFSPNVQQTSTSISNTTDQTFNAHNAASITMYPYPPPLPPPLQHPIDPFYPLGYYDDANKSTASQFAAFNMNMEQMMMKYHHLPPTSVGPLHHRNSPIMPPYESIYGYTNYLSYPGQYPALMRNNRNNSAHLRFNQSDVTQQQHQRKPSSATPPLSSTTTQSTVPSVPNSASPFGCANNSIESNSSSNGSSSGYASTLISTTSMIDPFARLSPAHNQYANYYHQHYQNPWPTKAFNEKTQQTNPMNENVKSINDSDLSFNDDFANFDANQTKQFDTIKRNPKESLISMLNDNEKTKQETLPQQPQPSEQISTNNSQTNNGSHNHHQQQNKSSNIENQMDIFTANTDPFEDDFFKT